MRRTGFAIVVLVNADKFKRHHSRALLTLAFLAALPQAQTAGNVAA
jgi:hypothetical protein